MRERERERERVCVRERECVCVRERGGRETGCWRRDNGCVMVH